MWNESTQGIASRTRKTAPAESPQLPEARTTGRSPVIDTSLAPPEHEATTRKQSRADRARDLYVGHAEEIALAFCHGVYRVPSCTGTARYTVRLLPEPYCSCRDAAGGECKHVMAVRVVRRTTAPCAGCGRRFRYRDLVEVTEDHESLTWFPGDRLCLAECAGAHGVL